MKLPARKISKILLIKPPIFFYRWGNRFLEAMPSLGLAYIAAVLRSSYDVNALDCVLEGYQNSDVSSDGNFEIRGMPLPAIERRIAEYGPDVVGVTAIHSAFIPQAMEVARAAKRVSKDIITIAGGGCPTFLADEFLREGTFDFVVRGEGEQTIGDLLRAIESGSDLQCVAGIAFAEDGRVVTNAGRPLVRNLDDIPFPALDLFNMEGYFRINMPSFNREEGAPRSRRAVTFMTSRGCPFRCSFCSSTNFWRNTIRQRSIENVIREMIHLKEKFRIGELQFEDDCLVLERERAVKLFSAMIEARLNLHWCTPNGLSPNFLDDEILELMRRSGCYIAVLSIESASEEVLRDIIGKPVKLARVKSLVKRARELGIRCMGYFMIGLPLERREQMERTIDFALEAGFDLPILWVASPLPGSSLYDRLERLGIIARKRIREIDYFNSAFGTDMATPEEIELLVAEFYLNNLGNMIRVGGSKHIFHAIYKSLFMGKHKHVPEIPLGHAIQAAGRSILRDCLGLPLRAGRHK